VEAHNALAAVAAATSTDIARGPGMNGDLQNWYQLDHADFLTLYPLLLGAYENGRDELSLTAGEKQVIDMLCTHDSHAGWYARGIRKLYADIDFSPVPETDESLSEGYMRKAGLSAAETTQPVLSQNVPNPATGTTRIDYVLPQSLVKNAVLEVYRYDGQQMDRFVLQARTHTRQLTIADWQPGVYYYSLVVDGKVIATRKMVVIR
jgi:hypothetical protein